MSEKDKWATLEDEYNQALDRCEILFNIISKVVDFLYEMLR